VTLLDYSILQSLGVLADRFAADLIPRFGGNKLAGPTLSQLCHHLLEKAGQFASLPAEVTVSQSPPVQGLMQVADILF
jgi:hypothetical protein